MAGILLPIGQVAVRRGAIISARWEGGELVVVVGGDTPADRTVDLRANDETAVAAWRDITGCPPPSDLAARGLTAEAEEGNAGLNAIVYGLADLLVKREPITYPETCPLCHGTGGVDGEAGTEWKYPEHVVVNGRRCAVEVLEQFWGIVNERNIAMMQGQRAPWPSVFATVKEAGK